MTQIFQTCKWFYVIYSHLDHMSFTEVFKDNVCSKNAYGVHSNDHHTYSFIKEGGMGCIHARTFLSWSGIYERKLQTASQDFMNRRIFCHTLISSLIPMQQCHVDSQHKDANVLSANSRRIKNIASLDRIKEENILQKYLTTLVTTTEVMPYLELS